MRTSSRNIAKYLATQAEPAAQQLATQLGLSPHKTAYQRVLIIPCYNERVDALTQVLANLPRPNTSTGVDPILVVVVANAPLDAGTQELIQTCAQLNLLSAQLTSTAVHNAGSDRADAPPMQIGTWSLNTSIDLLLVDRCSAGTLLIEPKQGVGLARKLGADIALAFIHAGVVLQPWIYSTDADAQLPADYFEQPTLEAAALCLAFRHHCDDPELDRRCQLYEQHMRLYAKRLAQAGSPYGYLSLGSALVCSAEHYAQVRGFPKRNAGEDFYLLNKLAKTGPIISPDSTPILLTARYSTRVPFGTGPTLVNWPTADQPYSTYPDESFARLAELLELLQDFTKTHSVNTATDFAQALNQLSNPIPEALAALDPKNELSSLLARNVAPAVKLKAVNDWFDALKTLRFVRFVSKRFPALTLE